MSHSFIIVRGKFSILCASPALEDEEEFTPFDLSDMLQIFHDISRHCCWLCLSRSGAVAKIFNFKYQKWTLNYPQGVVEACCRFVYVAKATEHPTIHLFLHSVGWWCIRWHFEIYFNVFLPNYLLFVCFYWRREKLNIKCVWSEYEGDDVKGSIMRQAMN